MDRYVYDGPVMIFNSCVSNHWKGTTIAETAAKAKSNLKYQFKKENNLIASSKVELPGKVLIAN